ncbi:AAA family ATPase [Alphaproteobacteria bacterium HT1-32]|nr:AAA family ATPase [Alphaproteobacteria bacterium HT1-32]
MATKKQIQEKDFVQLARIALTGRAQDIQVVIHRLIKQYRDGRPELADSLMALLRESPTRSSPLRKESTQPLPVDLDSRFQLLRIEDAPVLDHEPVFSDLVVDVLRQLVGERSRVDALRDVGLEPTRTVLFTGKPGVGKTMAARWLAREMKRPLLILDLAAVMSSYLGRTGSNLRHVLDYAKSIDCVLLLDELDAIAKRRDDTGEIGELKRLVTVLLQQLDDWPASGLLVAATNHSELLDPAIWRRFEAKIDFPMPSKEAAARFVEDQLADFSENASKWGSVLSLALQGASYSDLESGIRSARRYAALNGNGLEYYLGKLLRTDGLQKKDAVDLAVNLVAFGLLSQRDAQQLTGVSRDTIRKHMAKPSNKMTNDREAVK